ncbi:hypothetical protein HDU98_010122 [Podochytrium sp. JEL0797]|nr:hypothetical protein HDU98_010122 [Podochytrium sp. JEL0797]
MAASSINLNCTTFNPIVDSSCIGNGMNAITCSLPSSGTCIPVISIPNSSSVCTATPQTGTAAVVECLQIPLSPSGGINVPAELTPSTAALVTNYKETGCTGIISGGLYVLTECNPSPFGDGSWGIIYQSFNQSLYFDQYADADCNTTVPAKLGQKLSTAGTACNDKTSISITNNKGFKGRYYYSVSDHACQNVTHIGYAQSFGTCRPSTKCSVLQLGNDTQSALNGATFRCDNSTTTSPAYDIVADAKTQFGSQPYVLFDSYVDSKCQSEFLTRRAMLLDSCLQYDQAASYTVGQAANGSIVYSIFSGVGCTGAISERTSYVSGQCNEFNMFTVVNAKVGVPVGTKSSAAILGGVGFVLTLVAAVFVV